MKQIFKNWKKKMKKKFGGGFYPLIKVSSPVRKTSGFRTARTFKICRTSGPDVMSGRALFHSFQKWPKTKNEKWDERNTRMDSTERRSSIRSCLRNCDTCESFYDNFFRNYLCYRSCTDFDGRIEVDCLNILSIAPFLDSRTLEQITGGNV